LFLSRDVYNKIHISVQELKEKIDKDKPIYVICRSGNRSLQATLWLMEHGYKNVKNVEGGILAWSDFIDPAVRKY